MFVRIKGFILEHELRLFDKVIFFAFVTKRILTSQYSSSGVIDS